MRIAHDISGLGSPGGVSTYVRRVAAAQREAGHEVFILEDVPAAGTTGVTPRRFDLLHLHSFLPSRATGPVVRTMHAHWAYCPSGSRYLGRQGKPCDRAYSLSGCAWGHVVDRCGSIRPANVALGFRRTRSEMASLGGICVLTNSEFVRSQMIRSGYDGGDVHVLHLPAPDMAGTFDPARPNGDDGTPRFLFAGRIVPSKGLEWLLRSAARTVADFHLDVAGDGPQRQALVRLTEELGLSGRVTFHGWLEERRVFELVRAARAVVFPSVWHEPAGLVTLEAAANGRAVIASRVGGIPEYADKLGNALLVEPNDVPGLAAAIDLLAVDAPVARRLGQAGLLGAERMSLRQHVENLFRHYEAVIGRGG